MATVTVAEGRECVLRQVRAATPQPAIETVALLDAAGRVLAEDVASDRDYPPMARSARDGFALRAADQTSVLRVIGEVRAGESFAGTVGPGEAVEIMTGAPVPPGADSVVMIEHVTREARHIRLHGNLTAGEAISLQGSEARRGTIVVRRGRRLDFTGIAMLATVGCAQAPVYRRPTVSILATGDEIVGVDQTPLEFQLRNSNACSLAVQVARAGGIPEILPVARDEYNDTRKLVERGLASGLLLLSGGVSAGKYDLVERVLAGLDAEFYFDRVRIQPGQPLVFGRARGTFFFGLPGNPVSTMVTFEVFARAALELLGGEVEPRLPLTYARLSEPFRHKAGLTRFRPALLSDDGTIAPVRWAGSSDIVAATRANAFLVAAAETEAYETGDWIQVLPK